VTRFESFFSSVDQTQVHYPGSGPFELSGDLLAVSFQPIFQTGKLRPIRIQPDSKEPNLQLGL
jgi:hypothetical protein